MVFIIAGLAGALAAWSFTPNHWWAAILAVALMLNLLSSLKRKSRMRVTALIYNVHIMGPPAVLGV